MDHVEKGWGRAANLARLFSHGLCLPPPSSHPPPFSFPPWPGSAGSLWAAGAPVLLPRPLPPAGALTDESLLPRWGQARKGVKEVALGLQRVGAQPSPFLGVQQQPKDLGTGGRSAFRQPTDPEVRGLGFRIPSLHDSP